jgi:hypothetical protein
MPQFIRHHVDHDTHSTSAHNTSAHSIWALPILAGILVGCLLAFIANFLLKETRWSFGAATAPFAVAAAPESKPAPEFKEPVRYEAIILNWKQYREANQPKN